MIRIDSLSDPRVADYADMKEAERVVRRGIVLAEGPEVLRTLVESRFVVRSLFLLEKRIESVEDVVDRVDAPVYVASQEVMDGVAGFHVHRGVLAAADRVEAEIDLERAKTLFALEGVSNHDNIGAIFRNTRAFDVDAVLLDDRTADPLYRKAIRVSMGATLTVPFARAPVPPGFVRVALTPSPKAIPIQDVRWPDKVALLLGTEGPGLARETIAAADLSVRIPMVPGMDSLNVATASGVAAFLRFVS